MLEHYFAERAWSIILYAVISCCFFWILKNPKCKTTPVLWGYALILAILGFFFKPAESVDLYRLWMVADYYKGLPFLDMAQRVFMDWSGAPLSHIYLASLYTINMHLIPALTAWLFYVNIFYIISNYSAKKNINHSVIALIVFFFMSRGIYGEVISGIRNMLAFSFIARCVYNEIYNNTSIIWNIPIYVLAALFHQAAFALIGIRFAFYALFENRGLKRILYTLALVLISVLFLSFFENIARSAIRTAEIYINNDIYAYVWEYILNSIYIILCLAVLFYPLKSSKYSLAFKKIRVFIIGICIISITFINVYTIYHRFLTFAGLLALPALLETLNLDIATNRYWRYRILLACALFLLVAGGLRGNLNAIRFF